MNRASSPPSSPMSGPRWRRGNTTCTAMYSSGTTTRRRRSPRPIQASRKTCGPISSAPAAQGFDVIAIPHNANVSGGLMFDWNNSAGRPIDEAYAQRRALNEPSHGDRSEQGRFGDLAAALGQRRVRQLRDLRPLCSPNRTRKERASRQLYPRSLRAWPGDPGQGRAPIRTRWVWSAPRTSTTASRHPTRTPSPADPFGSRSRTSTLPEGDKAKRALGPDPQPGPDRRPGRRKAASPGSTTRPSLVPERLHGRVGRAQ